MNIFLHIYRIYASKSGYGFTPLELPIEYPIIFNSFPSKDNTTKIYFGEVPEDVKNVIISNKVLNKQTIDSLVGKNPPLIKGDDLIELAIKQQGKQSIIKGKHWATTVEITIPIVLEDCYVTHPESKHFWLNISKTYEIFESHKDKINSSIDYIISFITPEIGEDNLGGIIDNHFYITSEDEKLGFITDKEPLMFLESHLHYDINKLDLLKIKKIIEKSKTIDRKKQDFIRNIQHWYINTINESDPWKLFLWSFWGIEVLSKKYGKASYDEIIEKVQSISKDSLYSGINSDILETLIPEKGRTALKADFAIMVDTLSPNTAHHDLKDFHASLKIRNSISHGEPVPESQLPFMKTKMLFHKYYKLAIQNLLN
jgi:hypothetical protein